MTAKNDFMNFPRVCIEVKATFSFPSTINVDVLTSENLGKLIVPVKVEYQSRPLFCHVCKIFGHSPLNCPKVNFQWIPKAQSPTVTADPNSHLEVPNIHSIAGSVSLKPSCSILKPSAHPSIPVSFAPSNY